jgi:hypothetical protein
MLISNGFSNFEAFVFVCWVRLAWHGRILVLEKQERDSDGDCVVHFVRLLNWNCTVTVYTAAVAGRSMFAMMNAVTTWQKS